MSKYLGESEPYNLISDVSFVVTKNTSGDDKLVSGGILVSELKTLLLKPFLETQIGEKVIKSVNKYKGLRSFRDEYFEYLLLDGRELKVDDYPILARDYFTEEPTVAEAFNIEDYSCGYAEGATLRHLPPDTLRNLGSKEDWGMPKIWGTIQGSNEPIVVENTATTAGSYILEEKLSVRSVENGGSISQHRRLRFDSSLQAGMQIAEEVRVRNIGVQYFVKSKVLI